MKVLIPDPLVRNALAAARSLGQKGYHITAAIPNKGFQVSSLFKLSLSKYCKKHYRIASPFTDVSQYQKELLEIVQKDSYDALLPFNNISAIAISQIKGEVSKYVRVAVSGYETIEKVHDKSRAFALAKQLDIPTPKTQRPKSREELLGTFKELSFPIVIKARKNSGPRGIRFAKNKNELMHFFEEIHQANPGNSFDDYRFPILQEFIPGDIYDVFAIYDNGNFIVSMAQKRVHTYPVYGGVTCAGMTIRNKTLQEFARRLMDTVGWHGCCDLEFKLDARDGRFKLLEINPRFPGALDVAIQAGLDFAEIAVHLETSRNLNLEYKQNKLQEGRLYRFISSNEIYNLLQKFTIKRLLEFLNIFKRNVGYDFYFQDIGPNIYGLVSILKKLIFSRQEVLGNKGEDLNKIVIMKGGADGQTGFAQRIRAGWDDCSCGGPQRLRCNISPKSRF